MLEQERDGLCVGVHTVRACCQMFRKCDVIIELLEMAGRRRKLNICKTVFWEHKKWLLRSLLLAIISNKEVSQLYVDSCSSRGRKDGLKQHSRRWDAATRWERLEGFL